MNIFNRQRGISLYLSILIMAIVLALALGINSILVGQLKTAQEMKNSIKAFYAAESGIEYASYKNSTLSFPVGTIFSDSFDGQSYKAVVAGCGVFRSWGMYQGTQRAIERRNSPSKMVFAAQIANGDLGGVDGADNICQNRAKLASLTGSYKAWISGVDPAIVPANTFNQTSVDYFNLDCLKVAAAWANLTDGSIDNPIDRGIDNAGGIISVPVDAFAFTNTKTNGFQTAGGMGVTCNDWTSAGGNTKTGKPSQVNSEWTEFTVDQSCGNPSYIYCFEQ